MAGAQNADTQPTWAVVVVHGVGDAQPGGTLDAFVPSTTSQIGTRRSTSPMARGARVFNTSKETGWGPYFEKGFLNRWINIYREDDFVGTNISGNGKFPENRPVPAGGHTDYWRQTEVLDAMREFLPGPR